MQKCCNEKEREKKQPHETNLQKFVFVATAAVAFASVITGSAKLHYFLLNIIFCKTFFHFLSRFFRVHTRNLFSTGDAGVKPGKKEKYTHPRAQRQSEIEQMGKNVEKNHKNIQSNVRREENEIINEI